MTSVMWFRRDLRLSDNPALVEACADGEVLPLFVIDPALWGPAGRPRRSYLVASLAALDASLRQRGAGLQVVRGTPARRVLLAAKEVGAERVHVAADYGPYGRARDAAVEKALAEEGIELVRTGSPYAVAPGRVTKDDGEPYRVFTPFSKAWAAHGWRGPIDAPTGRAAGSPSTTPTDLPEPVAPRRPRPPRGRRAGRAAAAGRSSATSA